MYNKIEVNTVKDTTKIFEELNNLRFNELIKYKNPQTQNYKKKQIKENDKWRWCRTNEPINVCCRCKNKNIDIISHGIHSYDLLNIYNEYNNENRTYDKFHKEGVMFILENPSNNHLTCYNNLVDNKQVAQGWWWLDNGEAERIEQFPNGFANQKSYGKMFNSVINTFKLENAYMTNFVKCGKQSKNNFIRVNDYTAEEKEVCFNNYLIKEISILQPKVIFSLGKDVFNLLNARVNDIEKNIGYKPLFVKLPHPNSRIVNEDRKVLLYCNILRGLIKSSVITDNNEISYLWNEFVNK